MEAKYFYTIEQVADMLQVHSDTIRRAISSGQLSAAKIGDTWRIRGADSEDYFDRRTIKKRKPQNKLNHI